MAEKVVGTAKQAAEIFAHGKAFEPFVHAPIVLKKDLLQFLIEGFINRIGARSIHKVEFAIAKGFLDILDRRQRRVDHYPKWAVALKGVEPTHRRADNHPYVMFFDELIDFKQGLFRRHAERRVIKGHEFIALVSKELAG